MKLLLLSRYAQLGASSRLRSFQYIPYLESKGWQVDVSPLFSDEYVRALYSAQPLGLEAIKGYWSRFWALMRVKQYDLIWIEKELFPFVPAFAERLLNKLGIRYVVDYDDALFHRYDEHRRALVRSLLGHKIDVVMSKASLVLAGNDYLAERAQVAGASWVEQLPTVVDINRYAPVFKEAPSELVIGWIGSPSTTHYLLMLAPVFLALKRRFNVRIVAVGANEAALEGCGIEVLPWTESSEVASIQLFDVGIMPLDDSPWERGKCGYKLIQYMACGLPVVASPVGVNKDLVEQGKNGFLAHDAEAWEACLSHLLSTPLLRKSMGEAGRTVVESTYSLEVQASRLNSLMQKAITT